MKHTKKQIQKFSSDIKNRVHVVVTQHLIIIIFQSDSIIIYHSTKARAKEIHQVCCKLFCIAQWNAHTITFRGFFI